MSCRFEWRPGRMSRCKEKCSVSRAMSSLCARQRLSADASAVPEVSGGMSQSNKRRIERDGIDCWCAIEDTHVASA
jgi:hypothetical protein